MKCTGWTARCLLALVVAVTTRAQASATSIQWPHIEIRRDAVKVGVIVPSLHTLPPEWEVRFSPEVETLLGTSPVWIEGGSDANHPPSVVAKRRAAAGPRGITYAALPPAVRERVERRLGTHAPVVQVEGVLAVGARQMLEVCRPDFQSAMPPERKPGIEDLVFEHRRRVGKGTLDIEDPDMAFDSMARISVDEWTREFENLVDQPALSCPEVVALVEKRDSAAACGRFDLQVMGVPEAELRSDRFPATEAMFFGARERRHADVLLSELEQRTMPVFVIGAAHASPHSEVTRRLRAQGYELTLVRDEVHCRDGK